MTHYTYSIITNRNKKGKPTHQYAGKRNLNILSGPIPQVIENVGPEDWMGKKICENHERLMSENPHIARLETIATEYS